MPTPTPVIATLAASPGTVQAGATVTLTAQGVAESGGAVSSVSFYRDSDGNAQWDSSDQLIGTVAATASGQVSMTLSTAGLAPGIYQFFARAEDGSGNWSSAVAATLTVTAATPPGSNAATAVALTVGSTTGGTLATTGAVDWYKFQAVAGTCYVLQTGLLTLPDSVLTLYGTDGRTVLASNDDIAPGNYASRILWQAPAAGTYYLAVSSYGNDVFGQFHAGSCPETRPALARRDQQPDPDSRRHAVAGAFGQQPQRPAADVSNQRPAADFDARHDHSRRLRQCAHPKFVHGPRGEHVSSAGDRQRRPANNDADIHRNAEHAGAGETQHFVAAGTLALGTIAPTLFQLSRAATASSTAA